MIFANMFTLQNPFKSFKLMVIVWEIELHGVLILDIIHLTQSFVLVSRVMINDPLFCQFY